jgi:hypothetical protein
MVPSIIIGMTTRFSLSTKLVVRAGLVEIHHHVGLAVLVDVVQAAAESVGHQITALAVRLDPVEIADRVAVPHAPFRLP